MLGGVDERLPGDSDASCRVVEAVRVVQAARWTVVVRTALSDGAS